MLGPGPARTRPASDPAPGAAPPTVGLGRASPNRFGATARGRPHSTARPGTCPVCAARKVNLRAPVVTKTPYSFRDRRARREAEPGWGVERWRRWHLDYQN